MSTRWMKLESTTFCTLFYFVLFILNKGKIVFSVCFLNYPCNKNTLKIKVLQMSWKWSMIFCRIFKNFWHWEHTRGAPFGHEGTGRAHPPGRAPCLVGPWWLPSTYSCTHTLLPPTNTIIQLKPGSKLILLPFSISLLKAPLTELLGGIVPWYVTPPLVQLVFVLVLYSLQICAT